MSYTKSKYGPHEIWPRSWLPAQVLHWLAFLHNLQLSITVWERQWPFNLLTVIQNQALKILFYASVLHAAPLERSRIFWNWVTRIIRIEWFGIDLEILRIRHILLGGRLIHLEALTGGHFVKKKGKKHGQSKALNLFDVSVERSWIFLKLSNTYEKYLTKLRLFGLHCEDTFDSGMT